MLRLAAAFTGGFLLLAPCVAVLLVLGGLSPAVAAECGRASWYGPGFHGRTTASGAKFDQWAMTAAMPNRAEMGRSYRVTYRDRSVVVKITDLGPHKRLNRSIDLSRGAAAKLGMIDAGIARVCLERVR